MEWKRAIGFGAGIWAFMFLLTLAAISWGVYDALGMQLVIALVAGGLALVLAYYTEVPNFRVSVEYGASWIAVIFLLDYLVTQRFNPGIFGSWALWAGYALIFLAPLVRTDRTSRSALSYHRHGAA